MFSVREVFANFEVALRKESVDRNHGLIKFRQVNVAVALRKESVDRNSSGLPVFLLRHWSLSARRAWIEIRVKDLNAHLYYRRSPQGERG